MYAANCLKIPGLTSFNYKVPMNYKQILDIRKTFTNGCVFYDFGYLQGKTCDIF